MRLNLLPAVLGLLASLGVQGCSGLGRREDPPPRAATRALADARQLRRDRADGWWSLAREAVQRAAEADPEWIAPARLLDDLSREALLGHEALGERRAAFGTEASARDLYLAGRLEGGGGHEHLERAARQAPRLSWAQHGLAWKHYASGDKRSALRAGRKAVELARGSYELGFFSGALARYLLEVGCERDARDVLGEALADSILAEPERTELEVLLARAELVADEDQVIERGFVRALGLFEHGRLSSEEVDQLGNVLFARRSAVRLPDMIDQWLGALGRGNTPAHERLRARLLTERGEHGLAEAIWIRATGELPAGSFRMARSLEKGQAAQAIEDWLNSLPRRLLDEDGLPRLPALRTLVLASREVIDLASAARFGNALLDVGWFGEAESWASAMVGGAAVPVGSRSECAEVALGLAGRAAAGKALLASIAGLLERVDDGEEALVLGLAGSPETLGEIEDLEQLLDAMQPSFERYHGQPSESSLSTSPRLHFGGLAEVVHPGPVYSDLDQREGRGGLGEPVPGLAAELAKLGRFGLFGQAPGGGGPDGTILRCVGSEWRQGTHLGVPYAGRVAWCDGADIESRPGRNGASVNGAALHEGYWIDIDGVRRDWQQMRALERRFLGPETEVPAEVLEAAMKGRGPRTPVGALGGENACWLNPLGEGTRVLIAALGELPAPEPEGSRVSFDDWVELTALHEEGHLTDRTRFLPLLARWPQVLGFLFRHGFSPRSVARALEYRAQLVALCQAEEPRFVLAECLRASDSEGGVLPHGEAYRELVADLLEIAAQELERLPSLDGRHYLIYQLHFLTAEEVRWLALALARRNGMVGAHTRQG